MKNIKFKKLVISLVNVVNDLKTERSCITPDDTWMPYKS